MTATAISLPFTFERTVEVPPIPDGMHFECLRVKDRWRRGADVAFSANLHTLEQAMENAWTHIMEDIGWDYAEIVIEFGHDTENVGGWHAYNCQADSWKTDVVSYD